jgi:hypothetical protein
MQGVSHMPVLRISAAHNRSIGSVGQQKGLQTGTGRNKINKFVGGHVRHSKLVAQALTLCAQGRFRIPLSTTGACARRTFRSPQGPAQLPCSGAHDSNIRAEARQPGG